MDPALDPRRLAPLFALHGRLHLPGALARGAADLHRSLTESRTWVLSTLGGGGPVDLPLSVFEAMEAPTREALRQAALKEAREGFHYMYEALRMGETDAQGTSPVLEGFLSWLNGPDFLGFVRELTGQSELTRVDARGTCFRAGHYLTRHDDDQPGASRRLAYVLGLTPRWSTDWGGLLAFVDDDGHVSEAYRPTFNGLNLFRVPQPHFVSHVAPYAAAPRLSITGWIHVD